MYDDALSTYCRKKLDAAKVTPRRLLLWNGGANPNYPWKSWRAARVTFERPADSLCTTFQCATGFISQLPPLPY